jgi:ankyrin repeat protein
MGVAGMGSFAVPGPAAESISTDTIRFRQAAISGDLAIVSGLLDRDPALAWSRDEHGVSVYALACFGRQKAIADLLIARGLVPDIFDAAAGGNQVRVQELAKSIPGIANLRLPDGRTPLHFATAAGQADASVALQTAGADLSANAPETPLLAAVDCPDAPAALAMSVSLLNNASDPNACRKDGATALHLAAARGYAEIVRLLVHRGADIQARDGQGLTPLEVAVGEAVAVLRGAASIERPYYGRRKMRDRKDLPQSLINQFVSLSHSNPEKAMEMHRVCAALVDTRATWDEMAVEAAAHMGLTALAQYLVDAGAPVSTCTAALLGEASLVRTNLKEDPACLRERGAHGLPLLAYTAFGEPRVDVAEILLAAGADVHTRVFNQTVLHVAAARGQVEMARLLLEHGADVNATSPGKDGPQTPLGLAVRAKRTEMADFLRARGGRG